jgi:hypothetical protein
LPVLVEADFTRRDAEFRGFRIEGTTVTRGTGIYGRNVDGSRRWRPGMATEEVVHRSTFVLEANEARWRLQRGGSHPVTVSGDTDAPIITDDLVTFRRDPESGGPESLEPVGLHHPALALGFSRLRGIEQSGLALQGELPPYGTVRIVLSPDAPLEPVSMETVGPGSYRKYEYQNYRSFGKHRLPTKVVALIAESAEAQRPQDNVFRMELSVEKFEPISGLPDAPRWLLPGKIVIDERLGPPVRYSYEELLPRSRGGEMTAAELLAITRLRLGEQGSAPVPATSSPSPALVTSILAVAGLGLAAYALKKRS